MKSPKAKRSICEFLLPNKTTNVIGGGTSTFVPMLKTIATR